jgi:uncharacterized protein (UPF0332 family)
MVNSGALREGSFSEDDVVNLWEKAVTYLNDAQIPQLSIDGAISSAYNAAFNGCLAVLAQNGLRAGSSKSHHENVFAGVKAFGITGLDDLIPESIEFRSLRHGAMYDPALASEADRVRTIKWVKKTLPRLRSAIVGGQPDLEPRLKQV